MKSKPKNPERPKHWTTCLVVSIHLWIIEDTNDSRWTGRMSGLNCLDAKASQNLSVPAYYGARFAGAPGMNCCRVIFGI
jgi:hypothetical protein